MTRAYLGLGSNLGDRPANLTAMVEALDWGEVAVAARSSIYETTPVDAPDGSPDFLNQVIAVDTSLDALALWDRCASAEIALGRSREHEEHNGPRTVDIDLLLFGDQTVEEPHLIVPHPRMHERAFVLVPLYEIAPDSSIPGRGPVGELLDRIGTAGVRVLG